jgi:hypothetical protein
MRPEAADAYALESSPPPSTMPSSDLTSCSDHVMADGALVSSLLVPPFMAVPIWIWIERFPDERPATSSPFMDFVRYLVADLAMEG